MGPANRRIPGGSSSGAAISVADGMAIAAIGTDTGGSIRIPAALTGLTGFKPTARRVPQDGCFPLSFSLDSIGPLAASVDCCALVDAVMAGETPAPLPAMPAAGLRLGVAQTLVQDDLEDPVCTAFEVALTRLSAAGARLIDLPFALLADIPQLSTAGGLAAAEALALHRRDLESRPQDFDHRVAARILNGAKIGGADYVDLLLARTRYRREADALTAPFDAVIVPTCPRVAPRIADLESDNAAFGEANLAMLRNTGLVQLPRPLRHHPADPSRRQSAGRADGRGRDHGRPPQPDRRQSHRSGAGRALSGRPRPMKPIEALP